MRIQFQRVQEAMRQIRRNALSYSVDEYEEVLVGNLNTITDTKKKFQEYKTVIQERVKDLEEENINIRKLSKKEQQDLNNLRVIEEYLTRVLDEHQKILNSHFDLKILYTEELERLSQARLIQRFSMRRDLYDKVLKGEMGKIIKIADAKGNTIIKEGENYESAVNGNDLVLTIDATIQGIAEKYLAEACIDNHCTDGGSVIVMNPNNGDVLAMAGYPNYNLNDPFVISDEYKSSGSFNLTYVSAKNGTLPIILLSYIIPNWDLVSIDKSRIEDENADEIVLRNKIYLKETSYDAVISAFKEAGISYNIDSYDLTVSFVNNDSDTDMIVGDIIKKINGEEVKDFNDLKNIISKYSSGETIKISVIRDGKNKECYSKLYKENNRVIMGVMIAEVKNVSIK